MKDAIFFRRIFATLSLPLWMLVGAMAPVSVAAAAAGGNEVPGTAASGAAASTAHSGVAWVKPEGADMAPIFAQARAANKPVFVYWGAVWCPPCNQIKATVFNRQDFIERSKLFVPVYLDGDTKGAQQLGARFKVRGYPTMILFKPDGTELTRLPGEVQASTYMEVLGLGLASAGGAKAALTAALDKGAAAVSPEGWRLLAYYAWDQDENQLVPKAQLPQMLHRLVALCPPDQAQVASRLALRAILAAHEAHQPLPDAAAALAQTRRMLADATLARHNADVLVNDAADVVSTLTTKGSPDRDALVKAMDAVLDRLAADKTLYAGDRLSAVQAKVMLAKLDQEPGAKPNLSEALKAQVRQAVATTDKLSTSVYERQALIPNAADVLAEAGLLDESDALLKVELPQALSPYYHMLGLAANAKARGDTAGALVWAEKAWVASEGAATRLQWGVSYINRLIELSPNDTARIEKAASGVLAEVEPVPESFYERNRRGLERLGQRLQAWSAKTNQAQVVQRLSQRLDGVCRQLPAADESRAACMAVFQVAGKS